MHRQLDGVSVTSGRNRRHDHPPLGSPMMYRDHRRDTTVLGSVAAIITAVRSASPAWAYQQFQIREDSDNSEGQDCHTSVYTITVKMESGSDHRCIRLLTRHAFGHHRENQHRCAPTASHRKGWVSPGHNTPQFVIRPAAPGAPAMTTPWYTLSAFRGLQHRRTSGKDRRVRDGKQRLPATAAIAGSVA
jgi:hypothetical protein